MAILIVIGIRYMGMICVISDNEVVSLIMKALSDFKLRVEVFVINDVFPFFAGTVPYGDQSAAIEALVKKTSIPWEDPER